MRIVCVIARLCACRGRSSSCSRVALLLYCKAPSCGPARQGEGGGRRASRQDKVGWTEGARNGEGVRTEPRSWRKRHKYKQRKRRRRRMGVGTASARCHPLGSWGAIAAWRRRTVLLANPSSGRRCASCCSSHACLRPLWDSCCSHYRCHPRSCCSCRLLPSRALYHSCIQQPLPSDTFRTPTAVQASRQQACSPGVSGCLGVGGAMAQFNAFITIKRAVGLRLQELDVGD